MLHNDQITFAIVLVRIFIKFHATNKSLGLETEFNYLLRGLEAAAKSQTDADSDTHPSASVGDQQKALTNHLQSTLQPFKNLDKNIAKQKAGFEQWVNSASPEVSIIVVCVQRCKLSS